MKGIRFKKIIEKTFILIKCNFIDLDILPFFFFITFLFIIFYIKLLNIFECDLIILEKKNTLHIRQTLITTRTCVQDSMGDIRKKKNSIIIVI